MSELKAVNGAAHATTSESRQGEWALLGGFAIDACLSHISRNRKSCFCVLVHTTYQL